MGSREYTKNYKDKQVEPCVCVISYPYTMGINTIARLLLIIGGINWLLVGLVGWDVGMLFGGMDALISRVIYVLVGIAAIYELFTLTKSQA